ncbi:peptidoglycan-binding domain-containing protein [Roseicitreum antarcticum]|uniref:Caspase domain-containing protein n=1 Tax=Roseicitreum antarcticum TaxID=564137 RepID=A0A1H2XGR3_9RHOB|nr:peptidoglycan-binding protein [Roseicitreum antarcticum]SDW92083.1 Caspase domain-containing protein [Roseicitreum antarcticum]
MLMRISLSVLMSLALALPATAAGIALIIGNEEYQSADASRGAAQVLSSRSALETAGFEVITGENLSGAQMRDALAQVLDAQGETGGTDRVVIVLSGHFAMSQQSAWLMGSDMDEPGLARADGTGLRLDTVLEIASGAELGAVVVLAQTTNSADLGARLEGGLPPRLAIPQNVAVVRASPARVTPMVRDLMVPGTTLASVVDASRFLQADGYVPPLIPFLPEGFAPAANADRQAWADAQERGSEAGYDAYLSSFPRGMFAAEARSARDRLRATPERVEEALTLTRDERRTIQRDLTLLGFDTRGIDGIFGPGTRRAVTGWQDVNDMKGTGFLTREQIFTMAAQAARRAAELEEAERARQAEIERADRAFWRDVGAAGDEAGLRAYLDRYPEGVFAEVATERLDVIEDARRRDAEARDRAAWLDARDRNTVAAYEEYLAAYPEGEFAATARAQIAELRPQPQPEPTPEPEPAPEDTSARDAEAALGLPQITRVLIERRLLAEGYDPGALDGNFDANTRDAIAGFQQENGLPVTGYLTQGLVGQLATQGILGLFE